MPPAVQTSRSGRQIHRPLPRDALTLHEAQEQRDLGGQTSDETSGEESVIPPEPHTDDLVDREEDGSNLLDILRSIPGTQLDYDDDEPSGDEAGRCECQYDCPPNRWLAT